MNNRAAIPATRGRAFVLTFAVLILLLGLLFGKSLAPGQFLFSSDAPLGVEAAACYAMPSGFSGFWVDLNWVGGPGGSALPSTTYLILWALGPLGFAKFYTPLCLLALGLAAWLCMRQTGFRSGACLLGAMAAMLNTSFFSYACWGLGTLAVCVAWIFLAIAALARPTDRHPWRNAALAGLATGMAVVEGFDTGAILSLYVAAFVCFRAWQDGGAPTERAARAIGRLVVVGFMAAFIATQTLTVLIGTQVQGVAGMEQDTATKEARWAEATTWSLPKLETLRVIIPGVFGYRMDSPDGGVYWGRVGESPAQPRHSGSGVYGGILVVVVAFWAMLQSLLGTRSRFSPVERRTLWFWSVALLISLVLAWGKHAPLYRVFYAIPYFSTIRNPVKFMHPFSLALVILFGYGLHGLSRAYLEEGLRQATSLKARFTAWWATAPGFDRKWTLGGAVALVASLVGWALYATSRADLEAYLTKAVSTAPATAIAGFSLTEVGWFVGFLTITILLLTLILSGTFAGPRARWATLSLGVLLVADFCHASLPWVVYQSFGDQYSLNDLTERLREKPYEQRMTFVLPRGQDQFVALLQAAFGPEHVKEAYNFFNSVYALYHNDWLQNSFRWYNIQSLDLVQEPRPEQTNLIYRTRLGYYGDNLTPFLRLWQLTNTRYLLGLGGGFGEALNTQLDPALRRFRVRTEFALQQDKAGGPIRVRAVTNGPLALIEFTGALPRAKLFPHWQVSTNDDVTLATLANPEFDPAKTVLVSSPPPLSPAPAAEGATGTVAFVSYAPKAVRLKTTSPTPAVLLLNDKFDPGWSVTVDGQPAEMLRCNYLMRGVALTAGEHEIHFHYGVPLGPLCVSLTAMGLGLGLLGLGFLKQGKPALHPA